MTLNFKKSLGQNFLIDNKIINLITEIGNIEHKDSILEVGPGDGSLTKRLLEEDPKNLTVIEKDKRLVDILGEKFDGNDFLDQALQNGASYTLSSTRSDNYRHIFVEDLQDFLKKLCKRWLKDFNGKIIGITGSNGKTTTKDLIAHFLQSKFKVEKTLGNYNTSISVPLSIFSFSLKTEIYVLELDG